MAEFTLFSKVWMKIKWHFSHGFCFTTGKSVLVVFFSCVRNAVFQILFTPLAYQQCAFQERIMKAKLSRFCSICPKWNVRTQYRIAEFVPFSHPITSLGCISVTQTTESFNLTILAPFSWWKQPLHFGTQQPWLRWVRMRKSRANWALSFPGFRLITRANLI